MHTEGMADLTIARLTQACILDGNKYNSRCREEGQQSWAILRDCMVLHNQRREPLLVSAAGPTAMQDSSKVWQGASQSD